MGQTAINTTSQLVWLLGPALYLRLWHVNPAFQPPVSISYCVVLFWNGNKNVKVVGRPLNRVCWVKSTQNKIIVRIIEKKKIYLHWKQLTKSDPFSFIQNTSLKKIYIHYTTKYIFGRNMIQSIQVHYKVHRSIKTAHASSLRLIGECFAVNLASFMHRSSSVGCHFVKDHKPLLF